MPLTIHARARSRAAAMLGARAVGVGLLAFGLLTFLLAVSPSAVPAQSASLGFERIAQEHGLSNGTVTAIAQGRSGFLWFGTEDGLNRYDGSGFMTYRSVPGDSTSLGHSWVVSVLISRSGALWVGTLGGGLNRMISSRDGFRRYRHTPADSQSLSSDQVLDIHETEDGMLWLGTPRGLDRFDPSTGKVRRYTRIHGDSSRAENGVLTITEDGTGTLWLGMHFGIVAFDPRLGEFESVDAGLVTSAVRAVTLDREGMIWVGTENELASIDPATRTLRSRYSPSTPARPSPFGGRVMALYSQPGGKLWIGSDDGLSELDPVTGGYERHRHSRTDPLSLGGSLVRSVLVDRGGVLWTGLESYGLSKHAPSAIRFETIRDDPAARTSISNGYVRGISEDRRGDIWIGTQFGGLNRLDRRTREVTVYRHRPSDPRSLPGDNVWAALEDRAGTLWVGLHQGGLGTLDPRTGSFSRLPAIGPDESVTVLYEDRAGNLLVGTEGAGMLELSPDRRRSARYRTTSGDKQVLVSDDVQAILEDSEGVLWIGGAYGLTRLDRRTGQHTHFRGVEGRPGQLQSSFITSIHEDRARTLWFTTKGGGLSSFDRRTGSFTTIGTGQGLPHSFLYGLLEDAHGNLWVSSDDGIARLDPRRRKVIRYGLEDGLQAREFNRRAFLRSVDGTMYFGGVNGLTVFRPDRAAEPPPPPPVTIFSIRPVGGEARFIVGHTADSVVRLRHDENGFTISFRALDYTAPRKIVFSYRLEGVDQGWINSGNRSEATYASVQPGRYVFRVIAAGPAGVWTEHGASVTIVVDPPWWGTLWARALTLLAVLGVIAGIIRLRLAAARRRSAWLEEQVDAQTRQLTSAQSRLHDALEREREAARELFDITAAVPGAVFQMRETSGGLREFPFVSEGVRRLWLDKMPEFPMPTADDADRGLLAERLMGLAHPDDAAAISASLAESRRTLLPWHAEWRVMASDGTATWLSVQARASREPDGSAVWTGVVTDVTAARAAEAVRAALEAKMLQAQQAESLGVLAGGIAHDFNNLLVGVLGNAELLEDELPAGSEGAQTVAHIRSAAQRAAELTRQLLAYAGKGRFVVEPVNLGELVREMLALVRSAVPRTIAFDFSEEGDTPAIVDADATQLRQVVMNLVTNASEAIGTGTGQVRVRVGLERRPCAELPLLHVAPDMPENGPYAVLEVADDGVGLEPSHLPRIFDPFFTTKFTGRGLGLAALLGVVRAHHGGLHVITALGSGSRFLIYLPLASADALRSMSDQKAAPERPPSGSVGRVLVVDDEDDVLHLTGRMLQRLGHQVISADSGAGALAQVDAGMKVDLVLMDVTMPSMDGPTTARAIRDRGLGVPIVLMSGYAEEELVARGAMTNADGFLQKPFAEGELAAALVGITETATE